MSQSDKEAKHLSRRDFLKLGTLVGMSLTAANFLTACGEGVFVTETVPGVDKLKPLDPAGLDMLIFSKLPEVLPNYFDRAARIGNSENWIVPVPVTRAGLSVTTETTVPTGLQKDTLDQVSAILNDYETALVIVEPDGRPLPPTSFSTEHLKRLSIGLNPDHLKTDLLPDAAEFAQQRLLGYFSDRDFDLSDQTEFMQNHIKPESIPLITETINKFRTNHIDFPDNLSVNQISQEWTALLGQSQAAGNIKNVYEVISRLAAQDAILIPKLSPGYKEKLDRLSGEHFNQIPNQPDIYHVTTQYTHIDGSVFTADHLIARGSENGVAWNHIFPLPKSDTPIFNTDSWTDVLNDPNVGAAATRRDIGQFENALDWINPTDIEMKQVPPDRLRAFLVPDKLRGTTGIPADGADTQIIYGITTARKLTEQQIYFATSKGIYPQTHVDPLAFITWVTDITPAVDAAKSLGITQLDKQFSLSPQKMLALNVGQGTILNDQVIGADAFVSQSPTIQGLIGQLLANEVYGSGNAKNANVYKAHLDTQIIKVDYEKAILVQDAISKIWNESLPGDYARAVLTIPIPYQSKTENVLESASVTPVIIAQGETIPVGNLVEISPGEYIVPIFSKDLKTIVTNDGVLETGTIYGIPLQEAVTKGICIDPDNNIKEAMIQLAQIMGIAVSALYFRAGALSTGPITPTNAEISILNAFVAGFINSTYQTMSNITRVIGFK